MEKLLKQSKFLEHARVHGNIYGTSFEARLHLPLPPSSPPPSFPCRHFARRTLLTENSCSQSVEKVIRDGKICILDIDVQGVRACRKKNLEAAYVFVTPPSLAELERRLTGRGTESEEQVRTHVDVEVV
eukprot:183832-Hanusia_phi.AAC.1